MAVTEEMTSRNRLGRLTGTLWLIIDPLSDRISPHPVTGDAVSADFLPLGASRSPLSFPSTIGRPQVE